MLKQSSPGEVFLSIRRQTQGAESFPWVAGHETQHPAAGGVARGAARGQGTPENPPEGKIFVSDQLWILVGMGQLQAGPGVLGMLQGGQAGESPEARSRRGRMLGIWKQLVAGADPRGSAGCCEGRFALSGCCRRRQEGSAAASPSAAVIGATWRPGWGEGMEAARPRASGVGAPGGPWWPARLPLPRAAWSLARMSLEPHLRRRL